MPWEGEGAGEGAEEGADVSIFHNRLNFYKPTIKLPAMTPTPKRNIARARELRRDMTPPERTLWKLLRAHQMDGLHWRRQHPIGNYYADFACSHARLIVELDGRSHDETQDADANRDFALRELRCTTLRIPNCDLLRDPEAVWQNILIYLKPFIPTNKE